MLTKSQKTGALLDTQNTFYCVAIETSKPQVQSDKNKSKTQDADAKSEDARLYIYVHSTA